MADSGFNRPSLPTLIATLRSDLMNRLHEEGVLRRLDAEVYARVQAAAVHSLYGYLDYLARNLLPDQADESWLVRHAQIKRCPRKPAAAATGFVRWEGVAGSPTLPAGTSLTRDDQTRYTTTAAASAANGVLRAPVQAVDAGSAGNADDRVALRLTTPFPGLSSTAMAEALRGGEDIEALEAWRLRIMERWYWTPQGGADADYIIWAKEIPTITRAWTRRHWQGIGTVGVMIATNDADNPVPSAETIAAVKAHILPLAPVAGAGLAVFPVTAKRISLTLSLARDTPAIRAAVIAELKAFMLRDGEPGEKLYLSRISEAVSLAGSEYAHRLISPTQDIALTATELPVLGEVIWQNYSLAG